MNKITRIQVDAGDFQAVDKHREVRKREGRVCAGNPGRVPCAIQIRRFQNFLKVLKS